MTIHGRHDMAKKTCPVCGWEMTKGGQEVKVNGRVVRVCCDDCAAKVKADPAKYVKAKR